MGSVDDGHYVSGVWGGTQIVLRFGLPDTMNDGEMLARMGLEGEKLS